MAAKSYRCLKPLSYPASLSIRDRIRVAMRNNPEMTNAEAAIVRAEPGEIKQYAEGDKITHPPSDLIESWLRRGLVEPISSGAKKEVTGDDA